jgi:hypothetical protein
MSLRRPENFESKIPTAMATIAAMAPMMVHICAPVMLNPFSYVWIPSYEPKKSHIFPPIRLAKTFRTVDLFGLAVAAARPLRRFGLLVKAVDTAVLCFFSLLFDFAVIVLRRRRT